MRPALTLAACALLLIAACAGPPAAPAPPPAALDPSAPPADAVPAPVVSPVPVPEAETVTLYFPHRTEHALVSEQRELVRRGEQPEWAAVQALQGEPENPNARPLAVGGVGLELWGTKVFEGSMLLVMPRETAGRLAESGDELLVYALVNTVAGMGRVDSLTIHVDGGHPPKLMVGTVDLSQPVAPRWDLVQTSP